MRVPPWRVDKREYDVAITRLPLYAHLDTERHVNNVAVLAFHLEARLQLQMKLLGPESWCADGARLRPLRTVTQFLEQIYYGAEVTCAARLVVVGPRTFRVALAVFQNGRCAGVQDCLMGAWLASGWVDLPAGVETGLRAAEHPVAGLEPLVRDRDPLPASWPRQWPLVSRYADLDPDRCLGELALYRYVEQARARPIYAMVGSGVGIVIARLDVAFYRWDAREVDPAVSSGIRRIGRTSFSLLAAATAHAAPVVTGDAVLVLLDRKRGCPTPVTPALRAQMQPMLFR